MGLETATYINQLVAANPLGTDPRSQGDDHVRMVKSVLQSTFPGLTGAVTVTQQQINAVGVPGNICFPGMIVMWSGTIENIPQGWRLCNGTGNISTGTPVPNLVNRFIYGANSSTTGTGTVIGTTGGAATHTHTLSIAGTALTLAQIPSHSHNLPRRYSAWSGRDGSGGGFVTDFNEFGSADSTTSVGSGATHTHTGSAAAASSLPPYYALAFIIKD